MKKSIRIKVPVGTPENFEMVSIIAYPVAIKGFEEFQFCIHRPVRYGKKILSARSRKYAQTKMGWIVAGLPSGFKVPVDYDAETEEEAIENARATLAKHGKEKTREVLAKALEILSKGKPCAS